MLISRCNYWIGCIYGGVGGHVCRDSPTSTKWAVLNLLGFSSCKKCMSGHWQDIQSAAHVPGYLNRVADVESCTHNVDTEWLLSPSIFHQICQHFQMPNVDLFTSWINAQVMRYVSWRPDLAAIYIDALTCPWGPNLIICFLLSVWLGECFRTGRRRWSEYWPKKAWFLCVCPMSASR